MTRFSFGLLALIATSACSPSTQLVGDGSDNTDNSDALWRLGEDAEISVTRDGDWCENDDWSLWVRNITDNGRNNSDRWDDDPLEEGDDDTLEGVIGIYAGDLIYVNGGCDGDDDTWLVENSSSSSRITVNIEELMIDGEEYDVSDLRDDESASPDYGECVKLPRSEDLVCRVLDEDSDDDNDNDEDEWCDDDDGDGYGDPDQCAMYQDGEEPNGYVDNDDDCDDGDEDEHDECQSDDEVEYCYDSDGDGFGDEDRCDEYEIGEQPSSRWIRNDEDCDDDDPDVNPDEDEIENGVDDDCDGDEDDDDSDCEDCDESSNGDEVEVSVVKQSSWCSGEEWQAMFVHDDDYEEGDEWPMKVGNPDDANTHEDELEFDDGEEYRLQLWCDENGDGDFDGDDETWGLENSGGSVVEHVDRLEIDGDTYTISLTEDSTPSARVCNKHPDEYHFICKIDL
ncbi:hypothetical protein KBC55_03055 [Patescibacteria group bacterium]|nr:hypothetical protein [Patescibacteria group bacterium]